MSIVFRQLFDPHSCTYTYLLADPLTGDAVLIDTVKERVGEYAALLQEMNLQLAWVLETHAHADHVTGAAGLRELTGAQMVTGAHACTQCADRLVTDGDTIVFGNEVLRVIPTPGHTPGCITYHWRDRLFTGDTLLIGACGRTDFQGGDAARLYDSITLRLFGLPDETLVFPGHDYHGLRVSCIGQERTTNPRIAGKSREEFIEIMNNLKLPPPARLEEALPANLRCDQPDTVIDLHGF
ncbi:MAG: MBL fold metallo-hydrolase [Rhodocyclaceae bacterium]|jgi:glyoxylase-like metal-dependent hydrolase (beta-lactamase superfamily II)|nr:MBL fold metallo-hydrolase [Rhodocyclaceae bacterium]